MFPIMAHVVIGMTHSSRIKFQNHKSDYRGYIYFLVRIFKLDVKFVRALKGAWLPGRAGQLFWWEGTLLQHGPGWEHQCHTFWLYINGLSWKEKDDFGCPLVLLTNSANILSVCHLFSDLLWWIFRFHLLPFLCDWMLGTSWKVKAEMCQTGGPLHKKPLDMRRFTTKLLASKWEKKMKYWDLKEETRQRCELEAQIAKRDAWSLCLRFWGIVQRIWIAWSDPLQDEQEQDQPAFPLLGEEPRCPEPSSQRWHGALVTLHVVSVQREASALAACLINGRGKRRMELVVSCCIFSPKPMGEKQHT